MSDELEDAFWSEIYENRLNFSSKLTEDGKLIFSISASKELENQLIDDIELGKAPANATMVTRNIAHYDTNEKSLTIYPVFTWHGHEYSLPDKYDRIKSIRFENLNYRYSEGWSTLEGMLKKVPKCFLVEPYKGLGFKKDYTSILETIEDQTSCSKIVVTDREETSDSSEFLISHNTLQSLSKEIDNINSRANAARREVKDTTSYNVIAGLLGKPSKPIKFGRHPIRQLITKAAQNDYNLDGETQKDLIRAVEANTKDLLKRIPERVEKLRGDLELATLDDLIAKFHDQLQKNQTEGKWQKFFKDNPIILSIASSYPLILVQDEASVGGRRLDGKGGKISDFIFRNQITDNALVTEIKTPQEKLLSTVPYRGGVFSVSTKVTGAVNQVRDQKQKLIRELSSLKQNAVENNEELRLETFSVDCLLLVGLAPEGISEKRSWELFRGGLSDVTIITFDELLGKLKNVRSLF